MPAVGVDGVGVVAEPVVLPVPLPVVPPVVPPVPVPESEVSATVKFAVAVPPVD